MLLVSADLLSVGMVDRMLAEVPDESASSSNASPLLLASPRLSVSLSASARSTPSVVNLVADDLGGTTGSRATAQGNDGFLDGIFADEDDGEEAGGDHFDGLGDPGGDGSGSAGDGAGHSRVNEHPPDAPTQDSTRPGRQYGQMRPGPGHGRGGRKKGSGRRNKENFSRGLRRVVGAYLLEVTSASLASNFHVPLASGQKTVDMLRTQSREHGRQEVWLVPGLFGVIARWGAWRRDAQGDCASVCVWLAADGRSRGTCVGTHVHQDNHMHERPTTCQHAGALDSLLDDLAAFLMASYDRLRRHLIDQLRLQQAEQGSQQDAGDGSTFHVVGALHVALCPSAFGTLPVPLYLTNTRTFCGICLGARTRMCTHISIAQESGAPRRAYRSSTQSSVQSLEVSAVSRLPIPLHDCIAALRANGRILAMALTSEVFVLQPPLRCHFRTDRGQRQTLAEPVKRSGVIACMRGFSTMEVNIAKCSSCRQWVSRDGRDEHPVLLTLTSAATVRWVRSMANATSDGTPLTTITTRWLRGVRQEMMAGILPQFSPTRSGRVLRSLLLVGLRFMVTKLPPKLFTCHHCLDADGRYKFVSADSIWVGFGNGADHVRFDHVTEAVPENRRAIPAAYLVRGRSVRRLLRDVMKPKKDVKLHAKSVKAAEIAVGVLLPTALPPSNVRQPTEGEKAF